MSLCSSDRARCSKSRKADSRERVPFLQGDLPLLFVFFPLSGRSFPEIIIMQILQKEELDIE